MQIDGQMLAMADLSTNGSRLPRQTGSKIADLISGEHIISVINLGGGPVSIDAIRIEGPNVPNLSNFENHMSIIETGMMSSD